MRARFLLPFAQSRMRSGAWLHSRERLACRVRRYIGRFRRRVIRAWTPSPRSSRCSVCASRCTRADANALKAGEAVEDSRSCS